MKKVLAKIEKRKSKLGSDAAAELLFGYVEIIFNGLHLHAFQM